MNFKSFYLIESKIEDELEKSNLTDIAKITIRDINSRLQNKSKFVKFLIKNSTDIMHRAFEYTDEVVELLEKFEKNLNRLKEKDINKYFLRGLKKALDSLPPSKNEVQSVLKTKGALKVFENEKCQIFKILTKEAAQIYGANTKWCISAKSSNYFDEYTNRGVAFYFIMIKDIEDLKNNFTDRHEDKSSESVKKYFQKIAVAIYPNYEIIEWFNANDNNIYLKNKFSIADDSPIYIKNNLLNYLGILKKEAEIFKPMSEEEITEKLFKKFTKNPDGTYDSKESVYLDENFARDGKLIIKFKKVDGNFTCADLGLTTLEGCPHSVAGSFRCSGNLLKDLKGCPKKVGIDFDCTHNSIEEITDESELPEYVGRYFFAQDNWLFPHGMNIFKKNILIDKIKKIIRSKCKVEVDIILN